MYKFKLITLLLIVCTVALSTQEEKDCPQNEVVIVLDTSGTISKKDMKEAKELAKKIIETLSLSDKANSNKAALVSYADTASKRIYCDAHVAASTFNAVIEGLNRIDGELTNTQAGLEAGYEILNERGCQPSSSADKHKNKIILISDGNANRGADSNGPNATAALIRSKRVEIFAIGVGDVTFSELVGIAGNEHKALLASQFGDDFGEEVLRRISESFCPDNPDGKSTTTESPTTTPKQCSCEVDAELLKAESFTKYEIIRNYEGKCYKEKLEAAISAIMEQIKMLEKRLAELQICKLDLAHKIQYGDNSDSVFTTYDKCTLNIACSIKEALWKLKQKKEYIVKELEIEKAGFGNLEVTGYTRWFQKKFADVFW